MRKWINELFDPEGKTDDEIRQYCKDQIRTQLGTPVAGRHSDDALERAAWFAAIAQAFRSEQEQDSK